MLSLRNLEDFVSKGSPASFRSILNRKTKALNPTRFRQKENRLAYLDVGASVLTANVFLLPSQIGIFLN